MTTRAVVLAAGRGGRLERHTDGRAKCLVPVAGRPLIDYVLASLAAADISEAVLVVGHHGDQVEAALGARRHGVRLRYAWNPDPASGNAASLRRALPLVEGAPFLLVMSDHLCAASLLRAVLRDVDGRALAVDRTDLGPERAAEATKVALAGGRVVDLGKQLERWDAVDCGVSYWPAGALPALDGPPAEGELSALMARIARSDGGLAARDVTGRFWLDVDTEDDLRLAERLLRDDERRLD
jgi:choline kinase